MSQKKPYINLGINLPPLTPTKKNMIEQAAARGRSFQDLGTVMGRPSTPKYSNLQINTAAAARQRAENLERELARNAAATAAAERQSAENLEKEIADNANTSGTKSHNTSMSDNGRLTPTNQIKPVDPLGLFVSPTALTGYAASPINSNVTSRRLKFNSMPKSIEELSKDDEAFSKAIADLIAYEPDANGWAEVKFLVQVDSDPVIEEKPYYSMGGVKETYPQYLQRREKKDIDYVNKTYQRAIRSVEYFKISRKDFELSTPTTQCKIAGLDRRKEEISCWMCGYGTNLFKNEKKAQYKDGDVTFSICDPDKNQFECEHILPAALMAFLEYLANYTFPVTNYNKTVMESLYAGSCAMCNKIKSDHLYIKNTANNGTGNFIPDDDELMKDVIAFFSAIHGTKSKSPCADKEALIKKEGEDYYFTSIVTVNKEEQIKRRYPNLIWAMIHKDMNPPIKTIPQSKRRKTSENPGSVTYFGDLESVYNDLTKSEEFKLIENRDLPTLPDSIQLLINVKSSVDWIKNCYKRMRNRINEICILLNQRKNYWHQKYESSITEGTPNFIKRIIFETEADIQLLETKIKQQVNSRNERAKRRLEKATNLLKQDKEIIKKVKKPIPEDPEDPEARKRAEESAEKRVEDELYTFEEMRAKNERSYQGAFPRSSRLRIGPTTQTQTCKSNNKSSCSIQGGRYKANRKTRKARKAQKKNTRRK